MLDRAAKILQLTPYLDRTPLNLSGGLTADANGHVFVADNPPTGPSIVYVNQPSAPGDTTSPWIALPPIPGFEGLIATGAMASNVSHLRADDEGKLWVQWTNPATGHQAIISLSGDPAVP